MHWETSRIEVNDLKLFGPGGDFDRWMRRIEFELLEEGVRQAPFGGDTGRVNKTSGYPVGALRASIECDFKRMAPRLFELTLSANVPYALFVHEGTKTIIKRGAHGQFAEAGAGVGMYLPGNPGWGPPRWRQRVRGQRANPFLRRAFENVGRGHSAIKVWH